jgi:hypothetical protein
VDLVDLAHDRDLWRILLNIIFYNCGLHRMRGISSLPEQLLASQEGCDSTELVNWFLPCSEACNTLTNGHNVFIMLIL